MPTAYAHALPDPTLPHILLWPATTAQGECMSLADDPAVVGHLDPDTTLSHHSFQAALRAAAAVCQAVDAVVDGGARHAFCAVRPPGHHAGPRGKVPSRKDPVGSHGFCLLNNIAIAAAYAMNVHRWGVGLGGCRPEASILPAG